MNPNLAPAAMAVGVMLLAGCSSTTTFEPTTGPGPAWSFTDTDGTQHSRESSAGRPSLLFFMATWCGKCQATAPILAQVHEDRGNTTHFYTISWDPQEDAQDLATWKARYGHEWPHGTDPGSSVARTFGITSQSSIVVLDASGNMVQRWIYDVPSVAALETAFDRAAGTR